jgi:hypothetical protein
VLLIVAFFAQRLISPPGDESQIESVLETVATSEDPSYCTEDVTQAYLEQTTGAVAPFADELCASYAEGPGPDSVDVHTIEIDGNRATAIVDHRGGSFDGSSFLVELVEEDGDWKANRRLAFTSFDRKGFNSAYRQSFLDFGPPASAADCALATAGRFSDIQLQRIVLNGALEAFGRIAVDCDRPGTERAYLEGFREPEYDDFPPRAIACVKAKMKSLSNGELAALGADPLGHPLLVFNCDPEASLANIRHQLEEEGDLAAETIACVLADFRDRPPGEVIRLTYDQDEYGDLVEACSS